MEQRLGLPEPQRNGSFSGADGDDGAKSVTEFVSSRPTIRA